MKLQRIGFGFDCHRFDKSNTGENMIALCGCAIPCKHKIIAHSDGDVAFHALTDALLGAIGEPDIGTHFSPDDSRWRGQSSDYFVKFALKLLQNKYYGIINNIDLTIVAEIPKISPYREQLVTRTAEILSIKPTQVGIKATTTEGLGIIGDENGIACYAAVSVQVDEIV